jgi:hypothetical protein
VNWGSRQRNGSTRCRPSSRDRIPWGESYLETVGGLRAARNQAEECVGHELLSAPEIEENVNPDLQKYLDWKREAEQLRQQLCEFPAESLRPGSPSEARQSGDCPDRAG